jgi:hypothetical protein
MKHYELTTNSSNTLGRLDEIRMHARGRRIAKACSRKSEPLADMFMWLGAELRCVLAFAGLAFGALICRSKVRAVALEAN